MVNDLLIHSIRLSSVGPGKATGSDVVHELSGMDLAMKLHYLKGFYIFRSHAVQGLSVKLIKESTFYLFNNYYWTCGRLRRSDSGRPYLKCNDCGARFVEAQCDKTVDELLEMGDYSSFPNLLVYHQPFGPDLAFSPSIYLQVRLAASFTLLGPKKNLLKKNNTIVGVLAKWSWRFIILKNRGTVSCWDAHILFWFSKINVEG